MGIKSVKNIQKIIKIPTVYNSEERRAIASDILQYIKDKTENGESPVTGRSFPKYTKTYANSLDFKIAGKSKTPTLRLSGDMIASIEMLESKKGTIKIGFEKDSPHAGKAEGNQIGSYGQDANSSKARPFIGISQAALKQILSRYPIDNDKLREKNTKKANAIMDAAEDAADEIANETDFEVDGG